MADRVRVILKCVGGGDWDEDAAAVVNGRARACLKYIERAVMDAMVEQDQITRLPYWATLQLNP